MQIVSDLGGLERSKPTILTIGAFDGVHRGHQWLIRQVVSRAKRLDYSSMVISFDPVPQVVLRPGSTQLTDGEEKARIISATGADTLALLPFTKELSEVTAAEFLVSILDHVNLAEIWVGSDFVFGHNREGGIDYLIQNGQIRCYAVHIVPRQGLNGLPISSTKVRELVRAGEMSATGLYLGHYFSVRGQVATGEGRGNTLGFPTANLTVRPSQLLPAIGVYAGYVRMDGLRHPAAVSVGYNVVFDGHDIKVEAYLLDFDSDIRRKDVSIDFVDRISDEENFETVDELIAKMHRDVDKVRKVLEKAQEPGELILDA